jgi:threonine dehydrogenase-like Zn-dependent dehydrogenase
MRVSMATGPGETDVVEVPDPAAGPADVLVKMTACGICGSDELYIAMGGLPPHHGRMPLGHEPAGEVVEVGRDVTGIKVGDHVVVAVHKEPVPVDFVNLMANEITAVGSMGYPTEIFEVTKDLAANWEKYAVIVSHAFGFDDVQDALRTALTPGAADKVVVTFD